MSVYNRSDKRCKALLLISVAVFILLVSQVFASTEGPNSPASNNNSGSWTNPNNAISDGSGAATTGDKNTEHTWWGFNFNIPAGSTINGINVTVDAWTGADGPDKAEISLSWDGGSSWTAAKEAVWPTSETTITYGGLTDTWGRTWSVNEINSDNFRAKVESIAVGKAAADWDLDWIRITVNYTEDETPPEVNLISPANYQNLNSSGVEFNCTMNDNGELKNSTLYGNWSGGWHANETKNITGASNSTNFTKTIPEGTYIWNCYVCDNASAANCAFNSINWTFTVDTTAPNITLNSPDEGNVTNNISVIFNFTVTDNLADTLNCSLYINSSLNQTNSSTLNNTATLFNVTGMTDGNYTWNISCVDDANNINWSETRNLTVDLSAPSVISINLTPSSVADIDPDVQINITINATDATGVSAVIFQYRCAAGVGTCTPGTESWSNDTMDYNSGTGLYENASFTPDVAGTWQYRAWSNDTLGNANETSEQNLAVQYEYTWTRTPLNFETAIGYFETMKEIGNLTINNTGDYILNFDLRDNVPYGGGLTYNVTEPFNLTAKAVKYIQVNATFGTEMREDEFVLTIEATIDATTLNADPDSLTVDGTLVSYPGGPYLSLVIYQSHSASNQSESINLSAYVENIGNETGNYTWLNWSLPAGFTNTSGNLTHNIGNLTAYSTDWNNVTINIATTVSPGVYTIYANASCADDAPGCSDSEYFLIFITCSDTDNVCGEGCTYLTDDDCSRPGPGPGGEVIGGGIVIEEILTGEEVLSSSETFELVRGETNSFPVSVKNIFEGTTLYNVSIKIEGYLSQYMSVSPSMIDEISYRETKEFNVTITSPEYMERGAHELNITIVGKIIGPMIKKNLTETRTVTLDIHIVSEEEANESIELARIDISELENAGFPIAKVSKLLEEAKEALEEHEYENAKELSERIMEMKEKAFESYALIQEVKNRMISYGSATGAFLGIPRNFPETENLVNLAIAAFEREDYETALQRANDAQMTLALESGEFSLVYFLADWWWAILIGIALASLAGFLGYQRYMMATISRKIRNLHKEEENINKLIKDAQRKHFQQKVMGTPAFHKTMQRYRKRLTKIRQLRAKLRHKRVRLLRPQELIKDLEKERKEVMNLLKKAQENYLKKRILSRTAYREQAKLYNGRLTEIEDEKMTLETRLSQRGGKG